jgi:hypothetical protein
MKMDADRSFLASPNRPLAFWATIVLLCASTGAVAQAPKTPTDLAAEEEQIARRYREFETVAARLADLLGKTEPERAALMKRVLVRSRQQLVDDQFDKLVAELKSGAVANSVKQQESLIKDLNGLLELLLSEDRARELAKRREQLAKTLLEVDALRMRQKELRADTERAGDKPRSTEDLADRQDKLSEKAGGLSKNLGSPPSEGKGSDSAGDSKGDASGKGGSQGDSKSGGQNSGGSGEQAKDAGDDDGRQSETAGKQHLDAAQKAMREAKKRLEALQTKNASHKQDEAIRELSKAVAKLEEILRQLREEERLQMLTSLAARCKKMIEIQKIVLEGTLRLDQIPKEKRTRADEQQSIALSRREADVAKEADQALLLLRDDGTAVAFPETFQGVASDARLVVSRLGKADVGMNTQGYERDVLAALEDMSAALDAQIKEARQGQSPPQKGGKPGPSPLVDKLAELRMVRTLQFRVQQRTDRLTTADWPADSPERTTALDDLAERQARIYRITKELATEKSGP